jgi:hypothetical protein
MTNRYAVLALVACVTAIAACDKNGVQSITAPATGASVKFFNFGVGAPGVNFFAGTQKVTAISSTSCQPPNDTTSTCRSTGVESTTGTGYGSAAAGALYTEIVPGQVTLTGNISAATDKNLAISTVSTNLEDGKFYSYYISGIYDAATKKADAFVVEDSLPAPSAANDFTQAWVRFVNAVPNSTGPLTATVTLETGGQQATVGGATAYKAATGFRAVPNGVYTITLTAQGASAPLVTRTGVNLVGGRVYTLAVRGDATLPSTGASANRPQIDVTANR